MNRRAAAALLAAVLAAAPAAAGGQGGQQGSASQGRSGMSAGQPQNGNQQAPGSGPSQQNQQGQQAQQCPTGFDCGPHGQGPSGTNQQGGQQSFGGAYMPAPQGWSGAAATSAQPAPVHEDASGVYRSSRYEKDPKDANNRPEGWMPPRPDNPDVNSSSSAAPAEPGPATLDDARETIPSLIDSYIREKGAGGFFALSGSAQETVRLDGVDASAVRALGEGRFAMDVALRDRDGKSVPGEAQADLSGSVWRVDGIYRRRQRQTGCFSAAVKARVKRDAAGGAFVFHDQDEGRDWKLRLVAVHAGQAQAYGSGGLYSCVDFIDLPEGRRVDLDFYVSRDQGSCAVDQIVLHRIDGKPRVTRPKALSSLAKP